MEYARVEPEIRGQPGNRDRRTVEHVLSNTAAGGSCINDVAVHFFHSNLPFGGVNNSGLGSSHGHYGFKAFSHERAVLRHHKYSPLKLMAPPYNKAARRMIELCRRYL